MRSDHYRVRKKTRKHRKWGMKQDSTAWKFRTQNLVTTYTLTLRINLEHFLESILDILYIFRSSESQKSNASNGVQIRVAMKKLWSFEDNCTKLKGHFKVQLMNSKSNFEFIHYHFDVSPPLPQELYLGHSICPK